MRTQCKYVFLSLLISAAFSASAQSALRWWQDPLYLKSVRCEIVSYDDTAAYLAAGIHLPGKTHTFYTIEWGNVTRAGDSATVMLYTTVTGIRWDSGSLRQRGHRIALNVEVHHRGLLAAVAVPTLFTFTIGGLQAGKRYWVRFGEFILADDWKHVVRHWKGMHRGLGRWV